LVAGGCRGVKPPQYKAASSGRRTPKESISFIVLCPRPRMLDLCLKASWYQPEKNRKKSNAVIGTALQKKVS
jgi:hypothetical protein